MKTHLKIYLTDEQLAEDFALEIIQKIKNTSKSGRNFYLMLPGGNTPKILFEVLARQSGKISIWNDVQIYWGDERCVPPDHPDSNFGLAKSILLNSVSIPIENIHRIRGEESPEREAVRYAREISMVPLSVHGNPVFDLIINGIGEDGHTTSIFPNNMQLLRSFKLCEVSEHPLTHQKRITITGRVISSASSLAFLVTGKQKAKVIADIFRKTADSVNYPATYARPESGELIWLLDQDAASLLTQDDIP
jgi:6-phosphogluconolactonase